MNKNASNALSNAKDSWREALKEWVVESLKWVGDVIKWTSKAIFDLFLSWVEKWSSYAYKYAESRATDPSKKQMLHAKVVKHNQNSDKFFKKTWGRVKEIAWWAARTSWWALLTLWYAGKAWWHLLEAGGYAWWEVIGNEIKKIKNKRNSNRTNP